MVGPTCVLWWGEDEKGVAIHSLTYSRTYLISLVSLQCARNYARYWRHSIENDIAYVS